MNDQTTPEKRLGVEYVCSTCFFAIASRTDSSQITTILSCKRFPPEMAVFPSGSNRVSAQSIPRVVGEKDWCFEYRPQPKVSDNPT